MSRVLLALLKLLADYATYELGTLIDRFFACSAYTGRDI